MKFFYFLLLALGFGSLAHAQSARLSPHTKAFIRESQTKTLPSGYIYKKRNDGKVCVSAIIQVDNANTDKVKAALQVHNTSIGTQAGTVWTVQIPLDRLQDMVKIPGISYIQLDEPVEPALTKARIATRADSVHMGYGLPQGYSGKDVLIGIIDFGFDYNHPTMYDTSGNRYRILRSWEMNTSGTPPAGYTYGHELTDTVALKAQGTDNNEQTHGAGVAGIAAGSGYGSAGGAHKGMAYESDLVLVSVRRDSLEEQWRSGGFSDFIDGVKYLTDFASSQSKPIVVNISWGSHSGPHDGTSLVNQAFDAMSGPGKIIVMSAGNEGRNNLHLSKTFSSTDTALHTFLSFTNRSVQRTWIDIWGDTAKTFCVQATLYSKGIAGNTSGKICIDDNTHDLYLIADNGLDTCFLSVYTSSAEYNLKSRITINVHNKATDSVAISVTGNDGQTHLWNEYYFYGYTHRYQSSFTSLGFPWATTGNTNTTISDMGAGKHTLLIASYNTKLNYTDLNGIPRLISPGSVGYISYYSSRGPYVDGRIKPDIGAPGLVVTSSYNSWDTAYTETGTESASMVEKFYDAKTGKNYYWGEFSGTSAAAPVASGIVALLLQVNPALDPEDVRELVYETAIKDAGTGIIPAGGSNIWGRGKINAYGAVRKLLQKMSISNYQGSRKLDCVLFPNPGTGSFQLDMQATQADRMQVNIYEINGRCVYRQDWRVQAGQNLLPVSLNGNAKGIYFVELLSETDGSAISIKTTIQ